MRKPTIRAYELAEALGVPSNRLSEFENSHRALLPNKRGGRKEYLRALTKLKRARRATAEQLEFNGAAA